MPICLSSLSDLSDLNFDDIIDVRSPAEYAEDHIPGALNLPVLDDAERAKVGTIYKQVSPFSARKLGAALVSANAARHLQGPLADRPGGWRPLVYCWRGGQRSNSFATILEQIGWRVEVLDGGYRSYRRLVCGALHDTPLPFSLILLDGDTGTAKTALLAALEARGHQVLDLEGLAAHRGSIFGDRAGGQPAQRGFESALAAALGRLDPARPVVVEAESARIGRLILPSSLWTAMRTAPRVAVTAPLAARAAHLVQAYPDLTQDQDKLLTGIEGLRGFHAAERIEQWRAMARTAQFEALARELMQHHYDPRYAKASVRGGNRLRATVTFARLDAAGIAAGIGALEHALFSET